MKTYRAFGLTLASDLEFPELLPFDVAGRRTDVEIFAAPEVLGDFEDDSIPGNPRRLVLRLKKVGRFLIKDGARISYRRAEGADDDLLRLYLLGSCLGVLLHQRGLIVLHGNAVSTDGATCRMIIGHSGAGKSTEAAWHYREGSGILADDVCAVEFDAQGRPRVIPGYPQIKLWQASADLLGIPVEGLRRIHGREDKFAVPLGERFAPEPLPLTEIVELLPDGGTRVPIAGLEKVNRLFAHTYRPLLVERMGLKANYLKKLMVLAARVEMRVGGRRALSGTNSPENLP